jgi:hypothetical protein
MPALDIGLFRNRQANFDFALDCKHLGKTESGYFWRLCAPPGSGHVHEWCVVLDA